MSDHWSPEPTPVHDALMIGTWVGIVVGITSTLILLWVLGVIHLPPLRIGCS